MPLKCWGWLWDIHEACECPWSAGSGSGTFTKLVNAPGALGVALGHSGSLLNAPGALGVTRGHSQSLLNAPGALGVAQGHSGSLVNVPDALGVVLGHSASLRISCIGSLGMSLWLQYRNTLKSPTQLQEAYNILNALNLLDFLLFCSLFHHWLLITLGTYTYKHIAIPLETIIKPIACDPLLRNENTTKVRFIVTIQSMYNTFPLGAWNSAK